MLKSVDVCNFILSIYDIIVTILDSSVSTFLKTNDEVELADEVVEIESSEVSTKVEKDSNISYFSKFPSKLEDSHFYKLE